MACSSTFRFESKVIILMTKNYLSNMDIRLFNSKIDNIQSSWCQLPSIRGEMMFTYVRFSIKFHFQTHSSEGIIRISLLFSNPINHCLQTAFSIPKTVIFHVFFQQDAAERCLQLNIYILYTVFSVRALDNGDLFLFYKRTLNGK
ncbi:hypothetical protein EGR_08580 [Echinococcus granulosus]|uniref:Uncharacterized protein n=1 Tax=Echinococcus granulosus TaxID=6210 RepID=W6UT42_ECHGR|nr:hypothetical protein EGR_08580 [Echinococcus granulosus]EUB56554.1 hypothetical protein EGR_08580 [Echinococcus granulosus]